MPNEYMHLVEAAYARALESIAQGATKRETRDYIRTLYPALHADDLADSMADAIMDAADYGIEREDIDASWLR